jgi:hypothetical protein
VDVLCTACTCTIYFYLAQPSLVLESFLPYERSALSPTTHNVFTCADLVAIDHIIYIIAIAIAPGEALLLFFTVDNFINSEKVCRFQPNYFKM